MADAPHPPGVVVLRQTIPVIERVAPELAVRRKAVRRAARDLDRLQVLVQLEELGVTPDVGTVERHVDGDVTDDVHAVLVRVVAQFLPLAVEQVLHHAPELDLGLMAAAHALELAEVADAQELRPLIPGRAVVQVLERHEERVVIQPAGVLAAEDRIARIRSGKEALRRQVQDGIALLVEHAVVDVVGVALPVDVLVLAGLEQALLAELVEVDEVRVAGIGREGLVRGVAVARGSHGEDLPVCLARRLKEVDEVPGRLPHAPDSVARGQR